MKHPKLVVGYLMNDELFVKSVPLSKSHDWLKWLEVEELTEFFAELLELVTQISEEKEDSETLEVFLDLWREAGLAKENEAPFWESLRDSLEGTLKGEDHAPPWESLRDSLEAILINSERDIFADIAEAEQELDAPWIDIVEVQPEQRSTARKIYVEPEPVIDVTEQQRDTYLLQFTCELELSPRAHNCLERANIQTVRELVTKTEEELLQYKNLGQTTLNEIKHQLAIRGLYLGMDLDAEDYEEDEDIYSEDTE